MDWSKIFSIKFWLITRPDELTQRTLFILLVIFGLLALASIVFSVLRKREKKGPPAKLWQKLSGLCLTGALAGFILTFFRYEKIVLLGAHFWFLFLALGLLVWGVFILKYTIRDLPKIKKNHQEKKEFEKYLP